MNIVVIGSEGYVGPATCRQLRELGNVDRFDLGWFGFVEDGATNGDVREHRSHLDLSKYDCVVYLAAVSNDPMGKSFAEITHSINHESALDVAREAKEKGVGKFVFASSCSAYGAGGNEFRKETDPVNPLTDYAVSKVNAERDLEALASKEFNVYCMRFATACGASANLRLDLVVNDFVASALTTGKIMVLSDGEPFRPLIAVDDMARAICGVVAAAPNQNEQFNVYNVGSDEFTYKIRDLATDVSALMTAKPDVSINHAAASDNRSYKVDFSKFKNDFPDWQPIKMLPDVVAGLETQIAKEIEVRGPDYKNWLPHIRLKALKKFYEVSWEGS